MDSADKNREENTNQEWNDPTFSWEEMKGGIFDKITEEEPDFFAEKPRRRVAIWFWLGAVALVVAGLGVWHFANLSGAQAGGEKINGSHAPVTKPAEKQKDKTRPVAKIENEKTEIDVLKNNSEINTPANPSPAISSQPNRVVKNVSTPEKQETEPIIFSNQKDQIAVESIESGNALGSDPEIEKSEIGISEIPAALTVSIRPLDLEPTPPSLLFFQKNTEKSTGGKIPNDGGNKKGNEDKEIGKWSVAATGGSALSFSKYSGNSAAVDLRNENTSPYFGYQFGVEITAPLSEKSHLFFGANHAVVFQNIDIQTERQVEVFQQDIVLHETHYVVGNRISEVRGDTLVSGTERNRLVQYNEFRSSQIHAGYGRSFSHKKWNFSPFSGAAVGMVHHQEGYTVADDSFHICL